MNLAKYSASGNDFIIFHTFKEIDRSDLAKKLCDRYSGIGADGLIVLLPFEGVDFKWQFYNADGSEAAMCGNGSRAAAHYAKNYGLADSKMSFLTGAGVINATVEEDIVESELTEAFIKDKNIKEFGKDWWLIDTGVPHLVTFVDNLDEFDKLKAKELRQIYNANVNFAKVENGIIYIRTYERGVEDETLACGTGMAAAFYRAFKEGLVDNKAKVYPKSKEELILSYKNSSLYLKGRVKKIFETFIEEVY
ncbi:diaminopimelate epimerase [Nitrosophilus kaiyonis]|uniref:diaminopimelate epimerase n=1 Tax=Nitrosophilus kaiyonis TaxID=2930200 RepID=UPI00248FC35E|nr:diaminopimelate epimerase [Nitrosophilus kaiyonis]